MRVLHILDHSLPLHSGYVFRTQGILGALRDLGVETYQITGGKHPDSSADSESVDGFRFLRTRPRWPFLRRVPGANQIEIVASLSRRLRDVVEDVRPDVLHAHSPCLNGLAALSVSRSHRIPLVYEMRATWEDAAVSHGTTSMNSLRYRTTRALETVVLERADHVVTICDGLRADVRARGVEESKITVVPNAIDGVLSARPSETTMPSPIADLAGRALIGFFGSFYPYEGLDLLLDALSELRVTHESVCLVLVGTGPDEEALKSKAEALGLLSAVRFVRRVEHREIPAYYGAVRALVYPRLPMRLTEIVTPLKPLEAMAARRVVVASDVGGHRELIRNGQTGWLFRAGDVPSLVEALRRVLDFPDEQAGIVETAHAQVFEFRTWSALAPSYTRIYQGLCGAP